jgi:hypothetical protein
VRSVEFHPEAEAELVSAAQYFESHVENLGLDFILAVRRAYERILDFPDSGRELRAEGAGSPEQLGQLRGHVCFLRSPERGGDEAVRTYQNEAAHGAQERGQLAVEVCDAPGITPGGAVAKHDR